MPSHQAALKLSVRASTEGGLQTQARHIQLKFMFQIPSFCKIWLDALSTYLSTLPVC